MENPANYEHLHRIAKQHYERAEYNIAEFIKEKIAARFDGKHSSSSPIRLLDIGSGNKSILLKALERAFQQQIDLAQTIDIEIYLLDIKSFGGHMYGLDASPYHIVGEFCPCSYQGINFKAKFIELDFNKEIGTEKRHSSNDSFYKSELNKKFDIIVLNFVIHEILDSANLEIINDKSGREVLTVRLFFKMLFQCLHRLLNEGAVVFFGDAYFPKYISSVQTEIILKELGDSFGHSDAPALFLHPEEIIKTIMLELKGRFELCLDTERLTEIVENSGLYRKSYFIGLKKK